MALHWAALLGQNSVAELLLKMGATVDGKDREGRTALHCAAHNGNTSVAQILLANGAEVDATDGEGDPWNVQIQICRTPLHWAACLSHCSVADLLLSKGRTPLDWADDSMAKLLASSASRAPAQAAPVFSMEGRSVGQAAWGPSRAAWIPRAALYFPFQGNLWFSNRPRLIWCSYRTGRA
eukprot:Skav207608  [mRNA]  locus=scaffold1878:29344:34177:+ [translate_table: standard]